MKTKSKKHRQLSKPMQDLAWDLIDFRKEFNKRMNTIYKDYDEIVIQYMNSMRKDDNT